MTLELVDIESAVGSLLGAIVKDASPLFSSVQAMAVADRKSAVAAALDLPTPAVLFGVEGRDKSAAGTVVPGNPRLIVYLVATNLRTADGARLGDVDGVGAYELANETLAALDGAVVTGGRRIIAIDDRVVLSNERTIVFEQRWSIEMLADAAVPTFDGQAIAGAGSLVSTQVGSLKTRSIEFGFPGIDGAFRHALGHESRTIRWVGQLRADSHDGVSAIENGIEGLMGNGGVAVLSDTVGRTFERCALDSFNRRGGRYVHPLTGQVVQNFELDFVQLAG
ncbi:MAG: hypothetical protein DHS20C16_24130 [Phycisphaerae bacterium]|nr:MAG: hypothetical protein DHS20C16_24130 [Phycisphaerae bacterium]